MQDRRYRSPQLIGWIDGSILATFRAARDTLFPLLLIAASTLTNQQDVMKSGAGHPRMARTTFAATLALLAPLLGGAGANDGPIPNKLDTDYPSVGVLLDTKENSATEYSCALQNDKRKLKCDFTQSLFTRKLAPADIDAFVQKEIAELGKERSLSKGDKGQCAEIYDKINDIQQSAHLTDEEKHDLVEYTQVVEVVCRDPSDANIERLARYEAAQKSKTCSVTTTVYSLEFTRSFAAKSWVEAASNDNGLLGHICGAKDYDRFDIDSRRDNPFVTYWTYHVRRVITNPDAILLGTQCKKFEESDHEVQNQGTVLDIGCSTLDFSHGP